MIMKRLLLIIIFIILSSALLSAHILDEVSFHTLIVFEENHITLQLTAYTGPLFGALYLNYLDPDGDKILSEDHVPLLSDHFMNNIRLQMDWIPIKPRLTGWSIPFYEKLTFEMSKIRYIYEIPYPEKREGMHVFLYENKLEEDIAMYDMAVINNYQAQITILGEQRSVTSNRDVLTFGIMASAEELPESLTTPRL